MQPALLAIAKDANVPIAVDVQTVTGVDDTYSQPWLNAADILFCSAERLVTEPASFAVAALARFPPAARSEPLEPRSRSPTNASPTCSDAVPDTCRERASRENTTFAFSCLNDRRRLRSRSAFAGADDRVSNGAYDVWAHVGDDSERQTGPIAAA